MTRTRNLALAALFLAALGGCAGPEEDTPAYALAPLLGAPGRTTGLRAYRLESHSGPARLVLVPDVPAHVVVSEFASQVFEGDVQERAELAVGSGAVSVVADGVSVPVEVVPAGRADLWKVEGSGGARHLLMQGSCWSSSLDECKKLSAVDSAVLEELKKTGDVFVLTSTANLSNEERFAYFAARLRAEHAGVRFDRVVATSAGTYMLGALDADGVLQYERAFAFIGPFGGLLSGYEVALGQNGHALAEVLPESLDYASGSAFFTTRLDQWCSAQKSGGGQDVRFVALNFAGAGHDMLMPVHSHHHCAPAGVTRRISIQSEVLHHYNVGEDSWAARTMTDLVRADVPSSIVKDPRSGSVAALLVQAANGGLSINGLVFGAGGSGSSSSGVLLAQSGDVRLTLDVSQGLRRIDGIVVGRFDEIKDGHLLGYVPQRLATLPDSVKVQVAAQHPGLSLLDAYIALENGKLQAVVRARYESGTLRALFFLGLEVSPEGVELRVLSQGSLVYNALPDGLIGWDIKELSLAYRNGNFEGNLQAKGTMRMKYSSSRADRASYDIQGVMEDVHGSVMSSGALTMLAGLTETFKGVVVPPDPTLAIVFHVLQTQIQLEESLEAKLESSIELRLAGGVAAIRGALSGEAQARRAVTLFGIPLGSLEGSGAADLVLQSVNLGEYVELEGDASASAGAKLFIVPIATGHAWVQVKLRANFLPGGPRARAELKYRLDGGPLDGLTILSEDGSYVVTDHGDGKAPARYELFVHRYRWDLMSEATLRGTIWLQIPAEGDATIAQQHLELGGRGGGVFACDNVGVSAHTEGRSLVLPAASAGCYLWVRVSLPCGEVTVVKQQMASTSISGVSLTF